MYFNENSQRARIFFQPCVVNRYDKSIKLDHRPCSNLFDMKLFSKARSHSLSTQNAYNNISGYNKLQTKVHLYLGYLIHVS